MAQTRYMYVISNGGTEMHYRVITDDRGPFLTLSLKMAIRMFRAYRQSGRNVTLDTRASFKDWRNGRAEILAA